MTHENNNDSDRFEVDLWNQAKEEIKPNDPNYWVKVNNQFLYLKNKHNDKLSKNEEKS